ncbi:MAG: rod shape-determining protein MreC [Pseudomonadales bacterium]|nr:rod shape-determining protein MreC [Pseudomonadales bacterium]
MLGLSVLSLALMVVDHFSNLLDEVRAGMTMVMTPVIIVADYPDNLVQDVKDRFASREDLRTRLDALEEELLLLRAKTAKMAALTAENNRLRDLLGSAAKLEDNVLVAELIGVDPDPERQVVIVDKGSLDGVYVGQSMLDAQGLMGQVIEAGPYTSRVLLISDHSHSVPVQVVRSNLRLIAQGTGATNRLQLMHVQDTADIKEGDLLVSSGLGDRFPSGYPVGVVNEVRHDPGEPFAAVTARPSARLDRSRHVLLVFSGDQLAPSQVEDGNGNGS